MQQVKKKQKLTFNPPTRGNKGCEFLKQHQNQLRFLLIISNITFAFEFEFFNQFFKRNSQEIVLGNQNSKAYIDSNVSLYSSLLEGVLISVGFGYMRDFLSQAFTYYFGAFILIFQNVFKIIFLWRPNYHYYMINLYLFGISNGIYQDNSTTLLMQFSYKSQNLFLTLASNLICCIVIPKIAVFFIIQYAEWTYGYAIVCSIFSLQLLILTYSIPKIIKIYREGKKIEREEDPSYDYLWRLSYSKAPLQMVLKTFFNRGSKRIVVIFILLSFQIAFCQDQIYAGVKFFYSNNPSEYNGTYIPTSEDVKNDQSAFMQSSIIYIVSVLGLFMSLLTAFYIDKCKKNLNNLKYIVLLNGLVLSTSFIILNFINHTNLFNLDYPNINDIYNSPFYIVLTLSFLIGAGLGNCILFGYLLVMYGSPYKVKGTFLGVFTLTCSVIGIAQQLTVINLIDILAEYQFGAGILLILVSIILFFYIIFFPPRLYKQFVANLNTSLQTSNISVNTELSTSIN